MQRIYAIVIFIITATFSQAQINEVPLTHNPILQKLHAEKQQEIQKMLQKRVPNLNLSAVTRDPFVEFGTCVEAANSFEVCIDTTGFGPTGSITVFNQGNAAFGMVTLNSTCITYVADASVEFGIDSVYTEICSGTPLICDTTIYPIYAHRSNNTITLAPTLINAEDTITVCVDATTLPGDFISATVLGNDPQLGTAFPFGDCVYYEANKFAGTDVVTFEICDDFCVCDTYEIPFVISQDTVGLPFMDDFSYDGPRPNNNWLNEDVFVNNTMAIDPVSVGVATFDGLDRTGAPHGGGYGASDDLTSAYLNLDGFNPANNVYLSFYVQPQGLGEAPAGNDSLILEFKNFNNDWDLIDTFKYENLPSNEFTFFSYHINLSDYLFNGFQFRFRNFSNRSGNVDHWHLDYVRLSDNLTSSPFLPDGAFTEVPNPILKNYTSMPWWHFSADVDGEIPEDATFNEVHIFSHDEVDRALPETEVELIELETGTVLMDDIKIFASAGNLSPGRLLDIFPVKPADAYPTFTNEINGFSTNLKYLEFEKTYSITVSGENSNLNPIVEDNNVVTRTTIFDNYFAYDDGTAEGGFEATKNNVQIAMEFHTNVADSLKAVQLHFPHIKVNTDNQLFNLRVWVGELDDTPEYDGILQKPLYIDSYRDSLNGFTTYVLKDIISGERTPLAIPAGKFYVGWQQVSECTLNECIAVGTDKNNPDGMQNVFFDALGMGTQWTGVLSLNSTLIGSLMIRPVVGEGQPEASASIKDITSQTDFNIYPNPTPGMVNIDIENGNHNQFNYTIFDTVGKSLGTQPLSNQLNMSHLQNGIYFLKIVNNKTQEVFNHKIILVK